MFHITKFHPNVGNILPNGSVQTSHAFGHKILKTEKILQIGGLIPSHFLVSLQEHSPHVCGHDSFREGNS